MDSYKELGISLAAAIAALLIFSCVFYVSAPLFKSPARNLPAAAVSANTIIALVNSERISHGLSILSENQLLDSAAQMKANDMVTHGYYAHVSPDGKTPLYWLDSVDYRYLNVGENLVVRVISSSQAVDSWMGSPDHRENILRPDFTETGIGIAQGLYEGKETYYVVQIFATPYPHKTQAVLPAATKVIEKVPAVKAAVPLSAKAISTKKVDATKATSTPVGATSSPIAEATTSVEVSGVIPTPIIDTSYPVLLTTDPAAEAGNPLIGKEELVTKPETVPSESKNSLQLFVYYVGNRISDLLPE